MDTNKILQLLTMYIAQTERKNPQSPEVAEMAKGAFEKLRQDPEQLNMVVQDIGATLGLKSEQEGPQMSFQEGGLYDANGNFVGDDPALQENLNAINDYNALAFMPDMDPNEGYTAAALNPLEDITTAADLVTPSGGLDVNPIITDDNGFYINRHTGQRVILDGKDREEQTPAAPVTSQAATTTKKGKLNYSNETSVIQANLKSLGYSIGNYGANRNGVDGLKGKKTKAAISKFAKSNGMTVAEAENRLYTSSAYGTNPSTIAGIPKDRYNTALDNLSRGQFTPPSTQNPQTTSPDFSGIMDAVHNPFVQSTGYQQQIARPDLVRDLKEKGVVGTAVSRSGLLDVEQGSYQDRVTQSLEQLYSSPQYQRANHFEKAGLIAETDPLGLFTASVGAGLSALGLGSIPYSTKNYPIGTNELPRSRRVDVERGLPVGRSDGSVTPMGMGFESTPMPQSARQYNDIANNATTLNTQGALPGSNIPLQLNPASRSAIPNRRATTRLPASTDNNVTNLPTSVRQNNFNTRNAAGVNRASSFINKQIERLNSPTGMTKQDMYSSYRQAKKEGLSNMTYNEYKNMLTDAATRPDNFGGMFRDGGQVNNFL